MMIMTTLMIKITFTTTNDMMMTFDHDYDDIFTHKEIVVVQSQPMINAKV